MTNIIDTYNYGSDIGKKYFYEKRLMTPKEELKAKSLHKKLLEFEKVVRGNDELQTPYDFPVNCIEYYYDLGYISLVNPDKDEVHVYHYGNSEEEALYKALIEYEEDICIEKEFKNRDQLNKEYSVRFNEDDRGFYHGPFFFAELALQDFHKFYGDKIPQEILDYYSNYIAYHVGLAYEYDINENSIIKKEKQYVYKN